MAWSAPVSSVLSRALIVNKNGSPHTATGTLYNSDHSIPADEDINFSTFITLRPAEFLTQSSSGCGYQTNYWQVNVGNFPTSWSIGEDLQVDFQNSLNGEFGTLIYNLTANDPDYAPDFYLSHVGTPTPSPTPGYFVSHYNAVPNTGGPNQLKMLGTWGYFTDTGIYLNEYNPTAGDETGAFWNNGTADILVGVTTITSAMAADHAYGQLDIFGRDPDAPGGISYGLLDGADVFFKIYLLAQDTVSSAAPTLDFNNGVTWTEQTLAVIIPPIPTPSPSTTAPPVPSPSPSITPNRTPSATPLPTPHSSFPIIDFNGDGTSDIAIFRSTSGLWAVRGITRVYFGSLSDNPVPADYDGDGTSEMGIFRPSSGLWALRLISRAYFGSGSDIPVSGDYDGDGSSDIAIFRPASGLWAVRGMTRSYFGATGDDPAPGCYDGDGTEDIALFRKSSGLWAVRGITRFYFGGYGDEIVPGDYDGDRVWEAGIFRSTSGLWAIREVTRAYFGSYSDSPVPADYIGGGVNMIGIFRSGSGLWAIKGLTRAYFGSSGDMPVTR